MEFKYSDELSTADHPTNGLAGNIPVRRHRTPYVEDIGAVGAQEDWRRLVGPIDGFKGGMAHKYGLMQVAVPECRPERLEVITYASELGFLYDDCTEQFSSEDLSRANDNMQLAFAEGLQEGDIDHRVGGLKAMQSIFFKRMMVIDKPRALTAMKVWVEFLEQAAGRQHEAVFATMEAYMAYRMLDVGEMFWFGLVTFGMALTVPEAEWSLVRELTRPCWMVLALQNDFYSYDKEVVAANLKGASHVVNALWVLMEEHNIDLQSARTRCRELINDNIIKYQELVAAHKLDENLSRDARVYMESLLYTISGDAAWSLITPRYNLHQRYNKLQEVMIEYGVGVALDHAQDREKCRSLDFDEKVNHARDILSVVKTESLDA